MKSKGLCIKLHELDLTACWGLANENQIHIITKHCVQLRIISLQKIYSLTYKSLNYLSQLLYLTHLDISDCWNVDTASLVNLMQNCHHLQTLSIAKCPQVDISNPLFTLLTHARRVTVITSPLTLDGKY